MTGKGSIGDMCRGCERQGALLRSQGASLGHGGERGTRRGQQMTTVTKDQVTGVPGGGAGGSRWKRSELLGYCRGTDLVLIPLPAKGMMGREMGGPQTWQRE